MYIYILIYIVFTTERFLEVYIYIYIYIYIFGICYWNIFRSSYRKLASVGFESTTTEFRSDAPTDWAIRPWVQLALRANFVQLLQFHLFVQCSLFMSVFAFVSRHICFKGSLARLITLVAEWIDTYGIHHWRIGRLELIGRLEDLTFLTQHAYFYKIPAPAKFLVV